VLRTRYKIYLADAAIAPSVKLKGKSLLEDASALGVAVETAFFNHVFTRYYRQSIGFSYWKGRKDHKVDIIASVAGRLVPFEVKYPLTPGRIESCGRRGKALAVDPTMFRRRRQGELSTLNALYNSES